MTKIKVFISGHKGMVGSSIQRLLNKDKKYQIITRSRSELDLTNQKKVHEFFLEEKIDQVYLSAAKVGGINANNTFPANFIYENLMIQSNIIHGAFLGKVKKLLFLGSSCIYPKFAKQPMKEEELLTGLLESSNEPYAIAKISGIKLCESYNRQFGKSFDIDYRCIMPTNLYGIGDNYELENSHVIPALIRRFHDAKIKNKPQVNIWGSGTPLREFLFVDDLAKACQLIMELKKEEFKKYCPPMCSHINAGSGEEISIKDLSKLIKEIVDYHGEIIFDKSKLDGTPRKLIDSKRLNKFGWYPEKNLKDGLIIAYDDFLKSQCRL